MDLITIKRGPIEVPHPKRKKKSFELQTCTIPALNEAIGKIVKEFEAQALPLFKLEFEAHEDDNGAIRTYCVVVASRMETQEEVDARVAKQESYNACQLAEHKAKIEASKRHKELQRLTAHLSLEQLQALATLKPDEPS